MWLAFEFVFCYFYILETKQRSLEEISAIFDGEDAVNVIRKSGRDNVLGTDTVIHQSSLDEKKDGTEVQHLEGDYVRSY